MSITEVRQTVKTNVKEIGRQLSDGASETVRAAEEKKQLLDMEREILHDRLSAEKDCRDEVRELKKTVSREAEEAKNLL